MCECSRGDWKKMGIAEKALSVEGKSKRKPAEWKLFYVCWKEGNCGTKKTRKRIEDERARCRSFGHLVSQSITGKYRIRSLRRRHWIK